MDLTSKQIAFVDQLMRGASNRDAAVAAGYSKATATEAGARLARHSKVVAELSRLRTQARKAAAAMQKATSPTDGLGAATKEDPLAYLLATMNDPGVDLKLRVHAAIAALPFVHRKMGEAGKKEQRQEAAAQTNKASKFPAIRPPPGKVVPIRGVEPK